MPHNIIECSSDLKSKVNEILQTVHRSTLSSNLFDEADIKTRVSIYDCYQVGAGNKSFIHVASKILSGRTGEQKIKLSNVIILSLEALNLKSCSITVEVVDIDKESYVKRVIQN